jgi:hypothetical protein
MRISLLIFWLLAAPCLALTVKIPAVTDSNIQHDAYVRDLLQLVLEHSAAPGETVTLVRNAVQYSQNRNISELRQGRSLDVMWTMTTRDRESHLLPVRLPIFKGLLGYRAFLIRADDQPRFDRVQQLDQLAQMAAGQGGQWPDTAILRHAGLPVVTSTNYELLFPMLMAGRFDYFPRGLNEIWSEYDLHANDAMRVEPRILLAYPAPMYFFVARENRALAQRIEVGFRGMLADGSFERYFLNHPLITAVLARSKISERRIFYLDNPSLPTQTPLDDSRLWLLPPKPQSAAHPGG